MEKLICLCLCRSGSGKRTEYRTEIREMTKPDMEAFKVQGGTIIDTMDPAITDPIEQLNVALRWGRQLGGHEASADGGQ